MSEGQQANQITATKDVFDARCASVAGSLASFLQAALSLFTAEFSCIGLSNVKGLPVTKNRGLHGVLVERNSCVISLARNK